jgi:hypothetical protein
MAGLEFLYNIGGYLLVAYPSRRVFGTMHNIFKPSGAIWRALFSTSPENADGSGRIHYFSGAPCSSTISQQQGKEFKRYRGCARRIRALAGHPELV